MRLMVKCRPMSRRNGMYSSFPSQSSLFTMMAPFKPLVEIEVVLENLADARDIRRDLRFGQQLPRLIAAGRIAHLGGAASHEHDRPMSGALQVAQQHDRDQVADVQAVGRRVVSDIGRHHATARRRVQGSRVGLLVNESALLQRP